MTHTEKGRLSTSLPFSLQLTLKNRYQPSHGSLVHFDSMLHSAQIVHNEQDKLPGPVLLRPHVHLKGQVGGELDDISRRPRLRLIWP